MVGRPVNSIQCRIEASAIILQVSKVSEVSKVSKVSKYRRYLARYRYRRSSGTAILTKYRVSSRDYLAVKIVKVMIL